MATEVIDLVDEDNDDDQEMEEYTDAEEGEWEQVPPEMQNQEFAQKEIKAPPLSEYKIRRLARNAWGKCEFFYGEFGKKKSKYEILNFFKSMRMNWRRRRKIGQIIAQSVRMLSSIEWLCSFHVDIAFIATAD